MILWNTACTARPLRRPSEKPRRWASFMSPNADAEATPTMARLTYSSLTFAQSRNSGKHPPTHDWRRFKTLHEAERAAHSARSNKNPRAVEHGKQSWHKRQQKQKADTESSRASIQKIRVDTSPAPVLMSETTGSGEYSVPLSIARTGGSAALSGSSVGSYGDEN